MRRSNIFWGFILILVGSLFLVKSMGIELPGGADVMEYFWPLLLVFLGLWVIWGVTIGKSGEPVSEAFSIDLGTARKAALNLKHGAGQLTVRSGALSTQLLTGSFAGGVKQKIRFEDESLNVELRSAVDFPFSWDWGSHGLEWDMQINSQIPLELKLDTGANQSTIDLRDTKVTYLDLNTGASSTDLTLPAGAGQVRVDIDLGAASLDVRVPEGVAARIKVDQGITAVEIDAARFPYSGQFYQSANYDTAENRIDMDIDAGVGRIAVY
ncbi:MAG: hypothetical protein JXA13_06655 [Anaerolineales bacterium]|nr:hypothetical protein [Anaerolineales bacterium]